MNHELFQKAAHSLAFAVADLEYLRRRLDSNLARLLLQQSIDAMRAELSRLAHFKSCEGIENAELDRISNLLPMCGAAGRARYLKQLRELAASIHPSEPHHNGT